MSECPAFHYNDCICKAELEEVRKECDEQARLLGISGSKEEIREWHKKSQDRVRELIAELASKDAKLGKAIDAFKRMKDQGRSCAVCNNWEIAKEALAEIGEEK